MGCQALGCRVGQRRALSRLVGEEDGVRVGQEDETQRFVAVGLGLDEAEGRCQSNANCSPADAAFS